MRLRAPLLAGPILSLAGLSAGCPGSDAVHVDPVPFTVTPKRTSVRAGQTLSLTLTGAHTVGDGGAATVIGTPADGSCVSLRGGKTGTPAASGTREYRAPNAGEFELEVEALCERECDTSIKFGLADFADSAAHEEVTAIVECVLDPGAGSESESSSSSDSSSSDGPTTSSTDAESTASSGETTSSGTDTSSSSSGTSGSSESSSGTTTGGAMDPTGVHTIGAGIEQVVPMPADLAAALGATHGVIVAGIPTTYLLDLADGPSTTTVLDEAAPGLGAVVAPRFNEPDVWTLITHGDGDGCFAQLVDSTGVGAFGYNPFGVNTPPFISDMRVTSAQGDVVIGFAGGTYVGQLVDARPDYFIDFARNVSVPQSLGLLIDPDASDYPWLVISDGTPGSVYSTDDTFTPLGALEDSPRVGDCFAGDPTRCAVPNFASSTLQFVNAPSGGPATISATMAPGGATVRVTALESGGNEYWVAPLQDTDELFVCVADTQGCGASTTITAGAGCDGPTHSAALGEYLATSCTENGTLWVERIDNLLP